MQNRRLHFTCFVLYCEKRRYINGHLSTVTRQDIARQFGYSYSYITKIIRDITGSGFVT